jgi:hypothetical protein
LKFHYYPLNELKDNNEISNITPNPNYPELKEKCLIWKGSNGKNSKYPVIKFLGKHWSVTRLIMSISIGKEITKESIEEF